MVTAVFNPYDLGYPICRPRQYTSLHRRSHVELTRSWDTFFHLYQRNVDARAADIIRCPEEYAMEVMQAKAKLRGHFDIDGIPTLDKCLASKQLANHEGYEAINTTFCSGDGEYFYDCDQSVRRGSRRALVTTLISHGTCIGGQSQRIIGGLQCACAMGMQIFSDQRDNAVGEIGPDMRKMLADGELSERTIKDLIGNSIHEAVLGHIVMFVLTHSRVLRRRAPEESQPPNAQPDPTPPLSFTDHAEDMVDLSDSGDFDQDQPSTPAADDTANPDPPEVDYVHSHAEDAAEKDAVDTQVWVDEFGGTSMTDVLADIIADSQSKNPQDSQDSGAWNKPRWIFNVWCQLCW